MPHFKFRPLYQARVWGGRGLAQVLGRTLPVAGPVGESWEIVDRPEAQSVVDHGPRAGQTLQDLVRTLGAELMGPAWPSGRRFPILVKWLDCRERLSLQLHPPAAVAAALAGEPKTENWYVVRAASGAAVLAGLKPGLGRDDLAQALQRGTVEACIRRLPVQAGDSLLVHSGVMHAIDAGCLILEVQQNSDTTYRVDDWGRTGLDGRPRQLHLAQALACLDAMPEEECRLVSSSGPATALLAECAAFRLIRHVLPPGGQLRYRPGTEPRILSVVEGTLADRSGGRVPAGDNLLLPAAGDFLFVAEDQAVVLVTEGFARPPA